MRFMDQMGREVELARWPQRIVSLVPSQTELLFDLGLEKETVGITKFCIHPEEWFRSKVRIGGTKDPRIEKIKTLAPDLIIGNKEENRKEDIEALANDYPVWMSDVGSLEDALEMITQVGEITNRSSSANQLKQQIQLNFERLEELNRKLPPKRVAYFIWQSPYMVAGGGTFIDDLLKRAGLVNVYADTPRYPEINLSELAEKAPEVILLSSEPFPFQAKHFPPFLQVLPETRIEIVNGELFSWYGSRLLHSSEYFIALRTQF